MDIETLETKTKDARNAAASAQKKYDTLNFMLLSAKKEAGQELLPSRPRKKAGAEEPAVAAAAAAAVPAKKGKAAKKRENPANSPANATEEKKKAKKETAPPGEAWECAGNILTGEACPGNSPDCSVKDSATKDENGKLRDSCRHCKKAIKKARRVAKKE